MSGPSPPLRGQEISATHASELDRLGLDYWWMALRCAHVERALAGIAAPLRYLDFGCGAGTLTAHFIERLRPECALGVDGTEAALAAARARGVHARYADFREPLDLPFAPNAVTSLDVLEHLVDPVRALRHLADVAVAEATLIVTVPAMPSLTSRWDEVSGHQRRYTRRLLREQLREAGWSPRLTRYLFSFAVLPAFVERRLLRRVREFEFPPVSPALNRLLTGLGRIEQALALPFPFGTSLFAVATRRG